MRVGARESFLYEIKNIVYPKHIYRKIQSEISKTFMCFRYDSEISDFLTSWGKFWGP